MELKTGDIILIKGNRWISRMIMKFTNSQWSHAETVLIDEGELMLIGANEDGVRIKDFKKYMNDKTDICILRKKTEINYHDINIMAKYLTGTEYDFSSLIIYQLYMQLFHKWKGKRGKNATNKFYCSELSGYLLKLDKWWSNSPQDLYLHNELNIIYRGKYKEYNI